MRKWLSLALMALGVACSDATAPDVRSIVGPYNVVSVNGQSLNTPIFMVQSTLMRAKLAQGQIWLGGDGKWRFTQTITYSPRESDSVWVRQAVADSGSYRYDSGKITFYRSWYTDTPFLGQMDGLDLVFTTGALNTIPGGIDIRAVRDPHTAFYP